ncbi:MAG: hypothetical protein P8Y76_11180 [bacterium]|jgi:hypothetical protein
MDALKLFYEQQLDAKRRATAARSGSSVVAARAAGVTKTPERRVSAVAVPRAAEVEDARKDTGSAVPALGTTEVGDTPESLVRHLEQHAGESLRTHAAIDAYLAALKNAGADGGRARSSLLRETALVLFLVVAVLQYYYIDVSLEIASLNRVTVFVPVELPTKPRISES